MKVLLCGHTSFAARGLPQFLRAGGHEVTSFGRGPVGQTGDVVTGPIDQIHVNPHLQQPFDAVVNYILLKDEKIDRNVAYVEALSTLCRDRRVRHLVHISSVSSYKNAPLITESTPIETDPSKKGSYGSLKVASDAHVMRTSPPGTKLTMIRPGFILGEGMVDPIVGTGVRLPWNKLMVMGAAATQFPIITRELMHRAVAEVLRRPPTETTESLLLVGSNSPTRREYLLAASERLGIGDGVVSYPVAAWYTLAAGSEVVARLIGQSKLKPFSKLSSKLQVQRFDSALTQKRLGFSLDSDWRAELAASLDGQRPNFTLPYVPFAKPHFEAESVAFLGFGRIVKQKHLPALKGLGFKGRVGAYDLSAREDESGQAVRAIDAGAVEPADLFIVATPGPAHADAIDRLRGVGGAVLVEKPLCYSPGELAAWREFAASRPGGVSGGGVSVCHNYRFKQNVVQMIRLLARRNPGRLQNVTLDFVSNPVANDSVAWLRDERRARTLLMDYALHFMDLACMFDPGRWQAGSVRYELNSRGQTSLIEGRLAAAYSVHFTLRQGFGPRRARLLFSFQNYSVSLGFFPDTFVAHMAPDNGWLYKQESRESWRATRLKVLDRLLGRDSDASHGAALAAALGAASPLAVERLAGFYECILELGRSVYDVGSPEGVLVPDLSRITQGDGAPRPFPAAAIA